MVGCRLNREQVWSTSKVAKTLVKVPVFGDYFRLMQAVVAEDEGEQHCL